MWGLTKKSHIGTAVEMEKYKNLFNTFLNLNTSNSHKNIFALQ